MNKLMDWLLSQMRLVDIEDEPEEPEQEAVSIEKSWLELVHRKTAMNTDAQREMGRIKRVEKFVLILYAEIWKNMRVYAKIGQKDKCLKNLIKWGKIEVMQ